MAPKFKLEDWLGHQAKSSKTPRFRTKKRSESQGTDLPSDQANAVVVEIFPNQCQVQMLSDPGLRFLCSYRRTLFKRSEERERTPVAVGDKVLIQKTGESTGVLEGICQRQNELTRPAPGRDNLLVQHVLAANVDTVVILSSGHEPEFSPGFVDRFLVAAQAEGIPVLICITKADLNHPGEKEPWELYRKLGYDVRVVSSKTGAGIEQIQAALQRKTVVFCGQSGVGKTSLLRALLGQEIGKVGAVNPSTGKGRHTTTGAHLFNGLEDAKWIDTPGVREFGLVRVSVDRLAQLFPEFRELECTRRGCRHQDEEGCEAKGFERYSSYRRILTSLLEGEG